MATLTLKTKEIGIFGDKKRSKTLAGHILSNNLFKDESEGGVMSKQDNFLMEDGCSVDKRVHML